MSAPPSVATSRLHVNHPSNSDDSETTRLGQRALTFVRDAVPIAIVAWLVFHGIRTELMERYLVPSTSMEPTLHGDAEDGDVVLVDKMAFLPNRPAMPAMFDLVVIRNRWEPGGNHLVKRFIAMGPSTVWIDTGDLFMREPGGAPLGERVVKRPGEHPDLRQTAFVVDPAADDRGMDRLESDPGLISVEDGVIRVAPRAEDALVAARGAARGRTLAGHLGTAKAIDASFLDARGVRLPGGGVDVRDVGLELEVEIEPGTAALHLVVELLGVCYALEYAAKGEVRLRVDGDRAGEAHDAPALPLGGTLSLSFGYLDGHLFLTLGDELAVWIPVDVPWTAPQDLVLPSDGPKPPVNRLHVGVTGAPIGIRRIEAFHDVHYLGERGSSRRDGFEIEPGDIFVLGDNSGDSSDSRERGREPLSLLDLVGRPVAVLAPWSRRRWL
jgi:hypothetical protein